MCEITIFKSPLFTFKPKPNLCALERLFCFMFTKALNNTALKCNEGQVKHSDHKQCT